MVRAFENVGPEAFFRDREDIRPSPSIPRDGNSRSVRYEQTEQQRLLIDWDAASGLFEGEDFAYSAYLNPMSSGAQSLDQNRGFYDDLINSTMFRTEDLRPNERETQPEHADSNGGPVEGRTPAEDRLPRENIFFSELQNPESGILGSRDSGILEMVNLKGELRNPLLRSNWPFPEF